MQTGFCAVPMVRFDYNFPDVDEATRTKLKNVALSSEVQRFRGGGGGPNDGVMYVPLDEWGILKKAFIEAGLPELTTKEMFGDHWH